MYYRFMGTRWDRIFSRKHKIVILWLERKMIMIFNTDLDYIVEKWGNPLDDESDSVVILWLLDRITERGYVVRFSKSKTAVLNYDTPGEIDVVKYGDDKLVALLTAAELIIEMEEKAE